ncbi:MAG: B12-binding domain-containing radical SAM protein [Pleomorphochaeta sp.]
MNILLLSTAIEKSNLSFPLGALCIESSIKNDDILNPICKVNTLLFDLEDDPEIEAINISKSNIDIIGLSIYLWNRDWFDSFVEKIKSLNPNIIIFGGGSEVSANSQSFDLNKYAFLIAGEGEISTITALKQLINKEKISGLGIISKDNPFFSLSNNVDLSTLSSPLLTHTGDPFIEEGCSILWEMTRGCPFKCGFCFESKGLRSVRNYSFERIEKELDYIIEKGVRDIFVLDPTFNIDKNRTIKILHLIRDKAPHIHFTFEIRAELIDEDIAKAFSEIFCSLQIGLQSIHPSVLKSVNRNFNKDLFKEKVTLLEKQNLVYGLDLIIGLPNDNIELFKESLDFTAFCKPSNIDIFLLSLLPGTKLYDEATKYKLNYHKNSPYTLIESPTYSKEDIEKALNIKRGCDLFYTKGESVMFIKVICDAFNITPSTLFESFYDYLNLNSNIEEIDSEDIFMLQDEFIKYMINENNVHHLKKALLSYIEMHQGLSYYLDVYQSPILSLSYFPNQLSELDNIHINEFILKHEPLNNNKEFYIIGDYGNIDIIEY